MNRLTGDLLNQQSGFVVSTALIVALGGFLMGFDSSVISGVVGFIEIEFELSSLQLGWAVSSLTLTATLAMLIAGPLSDRIGRKPVLSLAAVLFAVSAILSAIAPNFLVLVIARMIGGLGVGASLIIAPMYIAEMAPPASRGRLVSFNQFNIVIGISVAFFSNYLILTLGQSSTGIANALNLEQWNWRWMLGIELLPAILYYAALTLVPESPRWLIMQGRGEEALGTLQRINGAEEGRQELDLVRQSISDEADQPETSWRSLFNTSMKLVLLIGISVGVLQQITGINAVFYYAPMIFEQSGIGTNAAFMQAVFVGLINVVFTVAALLLIDRLGRRTLLAIGLSGISICMLTLAFGFGSATYRLDQQNIENLPAEISRIQISEVVENVYYSDLEFRDAVSAAIGIETYSRYETQLVSEAVDLQPELILIAILGFVASFAISLGPVMWVLFSELFPNRIRGKAISFVGLINSSVAFLVTLLFPWELDTIGVSGTFLIFGLFALIGLILILKILPETKGKSLEQLEQELIGA
ncbi:MAG: sugar porter family MFS transporter [Gammaproteobacteria bacterium]|nr:sugar porter family MFS transporter [Gammaproteobacteria bacterium]